MVPGRTRSASGRSRSLCRYPHPAGWPGERLRRRGTAVATERELLRTPLRAHNIRSCSFAWAPSAAATFGGRVNVLTRRAPSMAFPWRGARTTRRVAAEPSPLRMALASDPRCSQTMVTPSWNSTEQWARRTGPRADLHLRHRPGRHSTGSRARSRPCGQSTGVDTEDIVAGTTPTRASWPPPVDPG